MFSMGIRKINFRIAALVGGLAVFSLGCGRQDKKDIVTMQTVPYAEAMKNCPDKVKESLVFTENLSTNKYVPLMIPAIKITNGNLFFTEGSLCIPIKPEPKVVPTVSASASAPIPVVSVSAPIPTISTTKSSAGKGQITVPPPPTTGGFRPQ